MKNATISFVMLVLALVGVSKEPGAAPPVHETAVAADVEAFAAQLAAADRFSGTVLLARGGKPLVRRGYGLADRARRRPNDPGTPFMLSSVGKMFTAIVTAAFESSPDQPRAHRVHRAR
jgi:CubicO group peptidase (beta-lactamase class C family)